MRAIFLDTVYINSQKRAITPKSATQKAYIDAIRQYDMVFGIGPAGTGKSLLLHVLAEQFRTHLAIAHLAANLVPILNDVKTRSWRPIASKNP